MREIKMRGYAVEKLCSDSQWLEGFGVLSLELADGGKEYFLYTTSGTYQVHGDSVGEYTGLKDKNGKEIYEGDVIKVPDLYETPENTYQTFHNEKVFFEYGAFFTDEGALCGDWEYLSNECEVVGNIYENPELATA